MLKLVLVPNPILSEKTKPIERFDSALKDLTFAMEKTLIAQVNPQGVGLAAPQIGKNLSLFIIKTSKKAKTEFFVNPGISDFKPNQILNKIQKNEQTMPPSEIVSDNPSSEEKDLNHDKVSSRQSNFLKEKTKKKDLKLEGCLSIPKIWGPVQRYQKVLLTYQDLDGKPHKRWFSGFKATVIQHEIDHLQGILFTQRTLEQKHELFEEKSGKLEKLQY